MKNLLIAVVMTIVSVVGLTATAGAQTANIGKPLTIMSYNVRNGLGLDDRVDYERIGGLIRSVAPDVVAIQELDSVTVRSGGVCVLNEIARAAGMTASYAAAIDYGGGKYGIGILSREKPISVRRIPLPGSEEARALIVAEFADYVFACTHLSLTEVDRLASAEIIIRESAACNKPFFIAGDFNDYPDSRTLQRMMERFEILSPLQPTWPADTPSEIIDYVMVDRRSAPDRITPVQSVVLNESVLSDHRPVKVSLLMR